MTGCGTNENAGIGTTLEESCWTRANSTCNEGRAWRQESRPLRFHDQIACSVAFINHFSSLPGVMDLITTVYNSIFQAYFTSTYLVCQALSTRYQPTLRDRTPQEALMTLRQSRSSACNAQPVSRARVALG